MTFVLKVTIIVSMNKRLFIIKLIPVILRPALEQLRKQAEETPSAIDDVVIQIGEIILDTIQSGEINDILG